MSPEPPTADPSFAVLHGAAAAVADHAHSPYSGYRVGAAILTVGGHLVVGCNVENAAYPEGTCAEAGAIAAMVATHGPTARIAEIVVVAPAGADGTPGSPCGGCRQRIREFATADTVVRAATADGVEVITWTVDELLPESFGPERLG